MSLSYGRNNRLSDAIKICEYYQLTESQSLDMIRKFLSLDISRSTYYNYKKKLYHDEKFQSLKRSIFKSKMLKYLMLYVDDDTDTVNSDGYEFNKLISERFPEKKDVFQIPDEQLDKESKLYDKIKSNFCIQSNYTIREEYVRCGKEKNSKCKTCPHGPYYYAYWRVKSSKKDKSILKKKYLGTIDPKL